MERKYLSPQEIIERYKKGEQDFSNIMCISAEFGGVVLAGAVFRNSDLSYSNFDHADLTDADFTGANLDWCSFRRAKMRKTNFAGASIKWSVLHEAILEQTSFARADLSWSLMFDTVRHAADWTDAITATCAFSEAELPAQAVAAGPDKLEELKNKVPYDIWMRIKFSLATVKQTFESVQRINVQDRRISAPVNVGYGGAVSSGSAALTYGGGGHATYKARITAYSR